MRNQKTTIYGKKRVIIAPYLIKNGNKLCEMMTSLRMIFLSSFVRLFFPSKTR